MDAEKIAEFLKRYRNDKQLTQAEMSAVIGVSLRTYQTIEETGEVKKADTQKKIQTLFDEQKIAQTDYLATRRAQKNQINEEAEGLTYIPISAQAGYARKIVDPMFKSSLQKLFIPGMPYRGERYRIFEVEGNSMEPTFKEHFHVITEKIDQEFWKKPKDYYTYVLVTEEDILLKRIYKVDEKRWILISDNPIYPQFLFDVSELKELWLVKRKVDWDMAPPVKFKIDESLLGN